MLRVGFALAFVCVGLGAWASSASAVGVFTATGSMSTARADQTASVLSNGKVLITGGVNTGYLSSAELYDPATGVFTLTGSMSIARARQTASVLSNGKVLITGGVSTDGLASSSAEYYDLATGVFTATGSMSTARYGQTASVLSNGKVLITGGNGNTSGRVNSAELYDPATGVFTATGSMSTARWMQTASVLSNGKVLITGGNSNTSDLSSAELYDPATGVFTLTGSMSTARVGQTASVLSNGKVLIIGGDSGPRLSSTELYDPATGVFTLTGSMNTARSGQTASVLSSGKVLITGGSGLNGDLLSSTEVYDPATEVFTQTDPMGTARSQQTASVLSSGKVLITGGEAISSPFAVRNAEVFEESIPDAPTGVAGSVGAQLSVVSWTAPASNGGSAITRYTVSASPGSQTCVWLSGPLSCTVTGLTNATAYRFAVTATNAVGESTTSTLSPLVTTNDTPGAPTSVVGTAANVQSVVSWTAPSSNGGAAITAYTVTASPGGQSCSWLSGPLQCTVTGLTNGTAYTFAVVASNAAGPSSASVASSSVTPRTVPNAPTSPVGTPTNTQVTVTWSPPADSGGAAVTAYTVTASPGGQTCVWVSGPLQCTVSSLANGTPYTFTVIATNAAGPGVASSASVSVQPRTVPNAPTGIGASAGNTEAVVTWTPPLNDGGSTISAYTVTASGAGGQSCGWVSGPYSCMVTSLLNGTSYTFTVTATNDAGPSTSSSASSAIIPRAYASAPTNAQTAHGNALAIVTWDASASTGGSPIASYTATASPGGQYCTWNSGPLTCTITGLTNGTNYTVTVIATNGVGPSLTSAASPAVTPLTTPGAAVSVNATAGNTTASVSWSAPASDGGAAITSYTATAVPSGQTCTWIAGPLACTITGLTNGTAYTFRVTATNTEGTGTAGVSASAVMPNAPSDPPTTAPTNTPVTLSPVTRVKAVVLTATTVRVRYTITTAGATHTATCSTVGGKTATVTGKTSVLKVVGLSYGKSYICDVSASLGTATSTITSVRITLLSNFSAPVGVKSPRTARSGSTIIVSWKASDPEDWALVSETAQLRTAAGAIIATTKPRARATRRGAALKVPSSTASGSYRFCVVVQDMRASRNREQTCRKITVTRPSTSSGSSSGGGSKPTRPIGPIGL